MTTPIVECIPNFSEARRPDVIAEILSTIQEVHGVYILDQHSDEDHNRTVVTFVGPPEAVEEATFAAIAKAADLIDLNEHHGEHPRIGATDVVPFVPISDITMAECVEMAKQLGKRVGEELKIPVYLYEEAAIDPERRNLAAIRKGQYETLKDSIATDQRRKPDFGPMQIGPAGATVIGAREFLVAYNVYLTSSDVEIAKKIARTIRYSSGGLRFVKALGLLVEGQAQVSMNLTNFRKTPLPLVVETIRREAMRYGVAISHTELVGLIPQDALIDTAVWYTQLDLFEPDQVLERKMYAALQPERAAGDELGQVEGDFIELLAAGTPTPGGGSAAAYAGAMAAALVGMVTRLTLGKKKYEGLTSQMQSILEEVGTLQAVLQAAVDADAAAFADVMAAYRLPKDGEEAQAARQEAIQHATIEAAQIPFQTARKTLRVLQLAIQAASLGNANAITDAGTAAALAQAAIAGAGYNVRINTLSMADQKAANQMLSELESIENRAAQFMTQLNGILKNRGGLPLP
jgi:glutamate formiminotransferase/formiminotetrahydrofolate cyclodeaminase